MDRSNVNSGVTEKLGPELRRPGLGGVKNGVWLSFFSRVSGVPNLTFFFANFCGGWTCPLCLLLEIV